MILDVHREAPLEGVEARPLGHGPALQRALELEPEIVVQPRRRVLLDDEGAPAAVAAAGPSLGLGRPREVALLPVLGERGAG